MADLSTRDAKLVQYLNEAYGKEKELETALQAHIAMTSRVPYRKRLRQHLTETKRHATEVRRRVKQLGGEPAAVALPGPDALSKGAGAAVELGSRAVAAAKGPLHAIRGTGEQEKMLKNAKSEYSEEHEEIATYRAIEVLASSVGDAATAQLARAIRREEERMAGFLERLIPTLTKAVVQEEVPASERGSATRSGTGRKRKAAAKRSPNGRKGKAAAKRSPNGRAAAPRSRAKASGAKRAAGAGATKTAGSKASRSTGAKKRTVAKSPAAKGASRSPGTKPAARKAAARKSAKR